MQANPPFRRLSRAALLLAAVVLAPAGVFAADKPIVSDVVVEGNRLTPTEAIKNQMKTRVGEVYDPEVLQEDVRTLFATRLFGNVWADVRKDGADKVKVFVFIRESSSAVPDLVVRVQEASTGSLMFGLGVNSDSGLTGSIMLNERNFDVLGPHR
jgi:outer membrane protein assembly factor BamA